MRDQTTQEEIQDIFSGLGMGLEIHTHTEGVDLENNWLMNTVDEMTEDRMSHNEYQFVQRERLSQEGWLCEEGQANHTFIMESLFTFADVVENDGEGSGRGDKDLDGNDLDEPCPSGCDRLRFALQVEECREVTRDGYSNMYSYNAMKWNIEKFQEDYKQITRTAYRCETVQTNEKFVLITTSNAGCLWIPRVCDGYDTIDLDEIDMARVDWSMHTKRNLTGDDKDVLSRDLSWKIVLMELLLAS